MIPTPKKHIYRQRFDDGLGTKFRIHVTVIAHEYDCGLAYDRIACDKIDAAIEKKYPGWYHRCFPNREGIRVMERKDCPACQRKEKIKQLKINDCAV